jgi:hypothetical protein
MNKRSPTDKYWLLNDAEYENMNGWPPNFKPIASAHFKIQDFDWLQFPRVVSNSHDLSAESPYSYIL